MYDEPLASTDYLAAINTMLTAKSSALGEATAVSKPAALGEASEVAWVGKVSASATGTTVTISASISADGFIYAMIDAGTVVA